MIGWGNMRVTAKVSEIVSERIVQSWTPIGESLLNGASATNGANVSSTVSQNDCDALAGAGTGSLMPEPVGIQRVSASESDAENANSGCVTRGVKLRWMLRQIDLGCYEGEETKSWCSPLMCMHAWKAPLKPV